jgi:hypothetical protein
MTAVAERLQTPPVTVRRFDWRVVPRWVAIPTSFAVVNATLFFILRPGVNDLWAARARASAARHGVGPTYWFSWFGGGSTPGNYSVLTPFLSAYLGTELVGALSAIAITLLVVPLVRGTHHPAAALSVATAAAGVNLWSGRIPFLLGSAIGVIALIAVQRRKPGWAALAAVVTILASPVSAAFVALGLVGTVLTRRSHRFVSLATIGTVVLGFGLVALAFGTPGPQHFAWSLCLWCVGALALFLVAAPPDYVRGVVYASVLVAVGMLIIPNGMGSNFGRFIWFCLPVAIVALSPRRVWTAIILVSPVLIASANLTFSDLRDASKRVASREFYTPLATELDSIHGLTNYRLEVVADEAHAAYDALLEHAMLARGWETQEDNHLNAVLTNAALLDGTSYKVWLDNNSVGWVAVPHSPVQTFPEYTLVASGTLNYLTQIWHNADWTLYRVSDAVPIVTAPQQTVLRYSQSQLIIRTSCACTFHVRIRYSKYLQASPVAGHHGTATVVNDGYGFTTITTSTPGDYVLSGSVTSIFH